MSKQGRPVLRYCAWTSVIPMLRLNSDFRAWAKNMRERPVHANPLNGREIVGAGINRLLRLSFALVKRQTFYQVTTAGKTNLLGGFTIHQGGQGDADVSFGSFYSKPGCTTWCPCLPGQTRMRYDGTPDTIGMNPYLTAKLGAR